MDSLIVSDAARPERLLALLHRAIDTLKVTPGEPLVPPSHQSRAPHAEPGSLVLHLTARYLERQGNDYVRMHPVLGTARSGQWAHLPSEDWVVLTPAEARKLLPEGGIRPGTTWEPGHDAMARLLTHFYPPTENTDVRTNCIDEQAAKATVLALRDGLARARVEGRLRMKHSFYHKNTDEFVDAPLVGILEFAADGSAIRSFRLVTDGATYGGEKGRQHFGAAVRSEP